MALAQGCDGEGVLFVGRAFVTSPHELAANAEAAVDSGAYDKGLALALEGLAANPDHPGLLRQAGRASLELGGDDAVAHLRRLTELAPTDAGAWLDLGLALAAAGDVRPAADAFARASALDPDDGSTLLHFAHAAHAAGRTDEGIEALERANARTQNPAALRTLLQLCRASGRLPQAIDAAERLLTAEPGDLPTLLTLAEVQLGL